MVFKEIVEETGKIPAFDFKKEYYETFERYSSNKPSSRIIKNKKSKEVIKLLDIIENEHNTSWYRELRKRAQKNPDALAVFYRGNKISFRELFENADSIAKSLKAGGIQKGDKIPCCISNSPELLYTMIAASKVGAKLVMLGTHLEKSYLNEILNDASKKIFIATDDNYGLIKDTVDEIGYDKKVVYSLADSLPKNPKECDEYVEELDKYYHYENKAIEFKKNDPTIMTKNDFYYYGKYYTGQVEEKGHLNDEFLITFTSGSTKKGRPKRIIHSNRSLIVSGYFNDLEISGSPKIPYQRGMCYIHSDSNTNLVTCISDNLMKLWSVACEPEYGRNVALDVIRLNNPSMIEMTTTHLIQMAKDYMKKLKEDNIKYKFPNLIATFAVGEPASPGEEKLLNKVLRTAKAGSEVVVKGVKLPFAPLSVGGGDCEHGGIFYNVFNSIKGKIDMITTGSKKNGMAPVVFGVVTAVKKVNNEYVECDYNERGILVANSLTSMVGYDNNKEATLKKIIRTSDGRDWVSCDAYGFIDKVGKVHQQDRAGNEILLENGQVILPSMIADCVLSDSKNILSCTVTCYHSENGDIPIINYELSPIMINTREKTILSMKNRIQKQLGNILGNNILYREFNDEYPFPEAGSGKRDFGALERMELENTFRLDNYNYRINEDNSEKTRKNFM